MDANDADLRIVGADFRWAVRFHIQRGALKHGVRVGRACGNGARVELIDGGRLGVGHCQCGPKGRVTVSDLAPFGTGGGAIVVGSTL